MPSNHRNAALRSEHESAILRILTARKGGTTAGELADILDMSIYTASRYVRSLYRQGRVERHGARGANLPRYTLPGETVTRAVALTNAAHLRRLEQEQERRRAVVIDALANGRPMSNRALAKVVGTTMRRLQVTLVDLQRAGEIIRTGHSSRTKYTLAPLRVRLLEAR